MVISKQRTITLLVLVLSLLDSSCGSRLESNQTVTPNPTVTLTSIPIVTSTSTSTPDPINILLDFIDPNDRVILRNPSNGTGAVDLSKIIKFSTNVDDYSARIFTTNGVIDVTYQNGQYPEIVNLEPGRYDIQITVTNNQTGEATTIDVPHFVVVDRIEEQEMMQRIGNVTATLNLANPNNEGFSKTKELIILYNQIPNMAYRFALNDPKRLTGQYTDMAQLFDKMIIITPNYTLSIETYMKEAKPFIENMGERVIAIESANEINYNTPLFYDPKNAVEYQKKLYIQTKLINPRLPVLFFSFSEGAYKFAGGEDPFKLLESILSYNNGEVCGYFDGISVHPLIDAPTNYGWNWTISNFLNDHVAWLDTFTNYCGFTPFVISTETMPPVHWEIDTNFVSNPQAGIDMYAEWYADILREGNKFPGMVLMGLHDWEAIGEGYPYNTELNITALKLYLNR